MMTQHVRTKQVYINIYANPTNLPNSRYNQLLKAGLVWKDDVLYLSSLPIGYIISKKALNRL
jgi:hypothetical protein